MSMNISESELKEIYDFSLDLAIRAGEILVKGIDKRCGDAKEREEQEHIEKDNAVDIVTQTDLGECQDQGRGNCLPRHFSGLSGSMGGFFQRRLAGNRRCGRADIWCRCRSFC
jgi:hypothetical protein